MILVVDDDPDHVELNLMALSHCCDVEQVATAGSGLEALGLLLGRLTLAQPLPRLILLDVKLPGMSGLDTLRAVRGHPSLARIPVVMMSSSSDELDRSACYDSGANGYLRKPTDFARRCELLQRLYRFWVAINRMP
jgi:two-component system response regulator